MSFSGMNGIASAGQKVRPRRSLLKFAREYLLSSGEWEEMDQVAGAAKPKTRTILEEGLPRVFEDDPSPEYLCRKKLETALLEQFRHEMASGRWAVTAVPMGAHNRQTIATELIENAKDVSFNDSRIGNYNFIEIAEISSSDRYLKIKWFIEQVCDVVEPKRGIGKNEILNLADRLLDIDVRDDIFKSAWADAKIPDGFRKPGR